MLVREKTPQELFDQGYLPTHYMRKEAWNKLDSTHRMDIIANKIGSAVCRKGMKGEICILETSRHIVFFVK